MAAAPLGVLMMAYGGPDKLDDVEPYLLDVRGYRPTPPAVVNEIRERYARIGGRSPILERTRQQAAALQSALAGNGGPEFRVFVGMRHWHPYIKDTLAEMHDQGVDRAVGLVMAPHYSRMSIGAYFKRVEEAGSPVEIAPIERWYQLPGYLDALAERVQSALKRFPASERDRVYLLFTAHSLPQRILEWGDPYPDELRQTVEAVMERLGPRAHEFAFQSAALTPDPWLGPNAGERIAALADAGEQNILVVPVGFVCEHVEILYDVDLEFQQIAREHGVYLERIQMLDDHPAMIAGLAGLVRQRAAAAGWT